MKNNVFIVNTPVQILNSVEARDRFHTGQRNTLVILRSPLRHEQASRQAGYEKMLLDLADDSWDEVWAPRLSKLRQLTFPVLAAPFVRRHRHVDTVYTGSFQSNEMHLINSLTYGNLVLIDDGNGIHETVDAYAWKPRTTPFRHRLLFKKTQWPAAPLHVFSCFDVDSSRCQLIRNDYRCFREKIPCSLPVRQQEIVFISQPLQRIFPHLTIKTQQLLDSLKKAFAAEHCRYLAHPREPLADREGAAVDCPVEVLPIREGYLPSAFITFFSSAARTLRLLYPVPVVCLRPSSDIWPDRSWADYMQQCYEEFTAVGATVMDLDPQFYVIHEDRVARSPWSYKQ